MRIVKLVFAALSITGFLSSLSYSAVPDRIPGAMNSGQTVALSGGLHRRALPQFDRGAADPALVLGSMTVLMLPTLSQRKALAQFVQDQQNPRSPDFHKWLTPEQWADRFGLSTNDVKQITSWLESQGFRVTYVARGRNWISFSGTAAQVQRAFGTEIHHYLVNGEMHVANSAAPKIPAALAGIVTGIRGMDDFHLRPRSSGRVHPFYNAGSTLGTLIAPGDIATMYDVNPLYTAGVDGSGQSLAVIGQTDIHQSDINDFRSGFGLTTITCSTFSGGDVIQSCNDAHFQYKLVTGLTDPGVPLSGDLSEADLDIELAGAVAKNAKIIYVNAPATFSGNNLISGGVWQAWQFAVDQDLAKVISLSYGLCEFDDNQVLDPATGLAAFDEVELQKANSLGITFVNSTGDTGAAGCDGPTNTLNDGNLAQGGIAVGYPASSPSVTGVGGTSISTANLSNSSFWGTNNATDGGNTLSYVPEQSWNDDDEIGAVCAATPSSTFCQNNHISDQQSAQGVIGLSATGGGPSNCAKQTTNFGSCVSGFPKPSWQTVTISGQSAVRLSPDISFLASANFPGFIFCTQLSEFGDSGTGSSCAPGGAAGIANALALTNPTIIGGTSVSAPIFAGMVALLNQYLSVSGQGNINPMLYQVVPTTPSPFHQVVTGTNTVYCSPGTPSSMPAAYRCPNAVSPATAGVIGFDASNKDATTGYNLVTGLGSVDLGNLATALAALELFSMTPTAASFPVAQGQTINATLDVAFIGSFTGPVSFKCNDTVSESTCTAPAAITAPGTVSFAISTRAATAALHPQFDRGPRVFYAVLLPGLLGIVLTLGSRKRSVAGLRTLGLIMVLGASTLWLGSCGGSNNSSSKDPGTPKGTHTVTVTGTSGAVSISQNITIDVQ